MFDIIIRNGTIVDGTGKEKYQADIGINRDTISEIGNLENAKALQQINAKDFFVCPGFVDVLNHSDSYFKLFSNPTLDSLALQGVTTIIGGNCGTSLAPLSSSFTMNELNKRMGFKANVITNPAKSETLLKSMRKWIDVSGININWSTLDEFLAVLGNQGLSLNFGTLIGHSSIRRNLVGERISDLSTDELTFFKEMIADSIQQGALGMSCGLSFSHENFVETSELMDLASVLHESDSIMSFHLRNEAERIVESVSEAIEIAKRSGVRVEISHFKINGKENWDKIDEVLSLVERASEKGLEINFDFYPYDFGWAVFYQFLPSSLYIGGREKMLKRLLDERERPAILNSLKEISLRVSDMIIAYSPFNKAFVGRSFSDIAKSQGISLEEAIMMALIDSRGHLICFDKALDEKNIVKQIKHPLGILSSDGSGFFEEENRNGQLVHPRCFGAFTRFLGKYVRDSRFLEWEKAIQKITSMPALKYGINNRGFLQAGLKADIAIFDPNKITDMATIENPFQYSRGIKYVLVNGKFVVSDSKHTKELAGEIIRK